MEKVKIADAGRCKNCKEWIPRGYYEQTVIHILTSSNSSHQKQVFEQEIKYLFYQLFERLLEKIRIELLDQQEKGGKFI